MTRCAVCLRAVPHAFERWDGSRVCDGCIARIVGAFDADRLRTIERLWRYAGGHL